MKIEKLWRRQYEILLIHFENEIEEMVLKPAHLHRKVILTKKKKKITKPDFIPIW